jgi:hypothetical protein
MKVRDAIKMIEQNGGNSTEFVGAIGSIGITKNPAPSRFPGTRATKFHREL